MESALAVSLYTMAAECGHLLGYGRTPTGWTGWQAANPYVPAAAVVGSVTVGAQDTQLGDIMAMVNRATRMVQSPPPADQGGVAHRWSFMSPEAQIAVVSGQTDYALPDDYGGFEGDMTYPSTQNQYVFCKRKGIAQVRRALQINGGLAQAPQWFAENPLPFDGTTGQRFNVVFFPTPDQTYNLLFRYNRQVQALTNVAPYPYGGAQFGELYLAAVKAACEKQMLGEPDGPYAQEFTRQLQAAIAVDARDHRPEGLGYNRDQSDEGVWPGYGSYYPFGGWHSWTNLVTYNNNSMG